MDRVAKARLVLDQIFEPVEATPGLVLDDRTPEIDELFRSRRRRLPGEALAHHHRDRVLDRRIGAVSNVVELAAMEFVVEHGGKVFCDARHAARADRLHARLLDRIEHGARLLAAGHEFAMHIGIVAGELERDANRHVRARSQLPCA